MLTRTKTTILALFVLLLAIPAGGVEDEASLDTLVGALQANKRAMVAASLSLDDEQAAAFWPIYDRYEDERIKVGERLAAVIEGYMANFAIMNDETAKDILEEYLVVEGDRDAVRKRFLDVFANAVPYTTVLRFYQIESKMDAVLRYDLASRIPVVPETPEE